MIKHYINVNEKDASNYIENTAYSYHIGFVYDTVDKENYKDANFGYIITNNKRFGLSYYELVGHLNKTVETCNSHTDDLYEISTYYLGELNNKLIDTNNNLNDLINGNVKPYYTNELLLCTNTGHKANLNEIRANKSTLKTNFITSVTIKIRDDFAGNIDQFLKPVYMIIRDITEDPNDTYVTQSEKYNNLLKCPRSREAIVQMGHKGKYVTFHFDPVMIKSEDEDTDVSVDVRYGFRLINISNDNQVSLVQIGCHVNPTGTTQDLICMPGKETTWQPAFGVNIAHMFNTNGLIESFNNYISIDWNSNPLYLRYFTTPGNYIIKGTRTNSDDDFPLTSTGFNFMANLQVLSSSFNTNTGITTYSITQILNLNINDTAANSYIYIRTGFGTISDLKNNKTSWSNWDNQYTYNKNN